MLSNSQRYLIEGIERAGGIVSWLGYDATGLPVVQFTDSRRTTEPFAIPTRTDKVGAVEPTLPVRWLSDVELDAIDPDDYYFLTDRRS